MDHMVNAQGGNRLVTSEPGGEFDEVGAELTVAGYEDLVNGIALWDR